MFCPIRISVHRNAVSVAIIQQQQNWYNRSIEQIELVSLTTNEVLGVNKF